MSIECITHSYKLKQVDYHALSTVCSYYGENEYKWHGITNQEVYYISHDCNN